ncbi:E3 ubiquitin-protein ligase RNF170-like isoform X1 [Salvia splendens]|uniref:E3 ubiquitin-protein ligase RNF170-like isoform X1 n=1 Tax=Salvia splendens TaxID=180675 RepID=UPI001C270D7C|nr:E3 ubiquitin-protein ligase RNF170-like isoform X1 [Salvia splendens]
MLSWFRKGKKNEGGGTRNDRPPEDDCCPICFNEFHVPCRTNCGHWFCGGCLLGLLRSVVKCPVCESWVYKLVPLLPALVQPGREEEASEILGEIEQFNTEDELRREFGELDELLREKKQNREDSIVFRIFMKYGDLIEGVTKALVCLLWFSFVLKQFVNIIIDFRLWPNEGMAFRLCQTLRCAIVVLGLIWMIRRHIWG